MSLLSIIGSILQFIIDNKWVILGYIIIFILIYINRKKFQIEGKVFFLYKTKYGVDFINKIADKNKKLIRILGYIGIVIGFIGMVLIVGLFFKGIYDLVFNPGAPAIVSPVIPGVKIPGSSFVVPFGFGILALFIVVLFHEFGHGIVARSHGIKIKSTGVGLLLILPLAFVEPDEKQVVKSKSKIQHSIFAAGPFMNVILALLCIALTFIAFPILSSMHHTNGIIFNDIQKGYAADKYGLKLGVPYVMINNNTINGTTDFINVMYDLKSNQTISMTDINNNTITLVTSESPSNKSMAYLGVMGNDDIFYGLLAKSYDNYIINNSSWIYVSTYNVLYFLVELIGWVYVLSLGIGLANLLPMGPVDGGRMIHTLMTDFKGKKTGIKIWAIISWLTFIALILLLIVPILRTVLKI